MDVREVSIVGRRYSAGEVVGEKRLAILLPVRWTSDRVQEAMDEVLRINSEKRVRQESKA